jgi:hypothetical protein
LFGSYGAQAPAQPADQETPQVDLTFEETAPPANEPVPAPAPETVNDTSTTSSWRSEWVEPARITLAQELAYKLEKPDDVVKNRASLRVEYSKYFLNRFFVQLDAKTTGFLHQDHRRDGERSDTRVSQAYLQTSLHRTSVSMGIQTVAWGESILAPITDDVSPRDNRELFNFNLEELRIGQAMLVLDQYSDAGRFSAFVTPEPSFNESPGVHSAYYFDPFGGATRYDAPGDPGSEYGVSWRKSFGGADVSIMAASLVDNDYAFRQDVGGRIVRETNRYSMAGTTFSYSRGKFLWKGEAGLKTSKVYNVDGLQLVQKDAFDTYLGLEYRHDASLSLSLEGVNQHVMDWTSAIQGTPRDRQSLLLNVTKLMMNDDLSINVLNFYSQPGSALLTMLLTSYQWNDNLTLDLNVAYPYTRSATSTLWNVRDQKQIAFKVQYQF